MNWRNLTGGHFSDSNRILFAFPITKHRGLPLDMEQEVLKKKFLTCLLVMLGIAFLFSIKGVWDNHQSARYTRRIEKIQEQIGSSINKNKIEPLLLERREAQRKLAHYYGFPKFFFFSLVIVYILLAIWAVSIFKKLPPGTRLQRLSALRLAITLVAFTIIIVCFLAIRYHRVSGTAGIILLLLFQWVIIGGVGGICLTDRVYEALTGSRKPKGFIEGPPPPAW